jgi:hypothetical protein
VWAQLPDAELDDLEALKPSTSRLRINAKSAICTELNRVDTTVGLAARSWAWANATDRYG